MKLLVSFVAALGVAAAAKPLRRFQKRHDAGLASLRGRSTEASSARPTGYTPYTFDQPVRSHATLDGRN